MSEKTEKNKWSKLESQVKREIKFAPKGENITILTDEPYTEEIDGKYGKQQMYIVNTNIGLVALNRTQFLHVAANMAARDYKLPVNFGR